MRKSTAALETGSLRRLSEPDCVFTKAVLGIGVAAGVGVGVPLVVGAGVGVTEGAGVGVLVLNPR